MFNVMLIRQNYKERYNFHKAAHSVYLFKKQQKRSQYFQIVQSEQAFMVIKVWSKHQSMTVPLMRDQFTCSF